MNKLQLIIRGTLACFAEVWLDDEKMGIITAKSHNLGWRFISHMFDFQDCDAVNLDILIELIQTEIEEREVI